MKILWISPTPSHPQDAGNRAHIHALGREVLAAGHEVTFLLYAQETVTDEGLEAMRAFWPHFLLVPHRLRQRKRSKGSHWGIDDWFNADIEAAVRFVATQTRFDIVHCEYVFFSKALTLFGRDTLKVLNCHDRMSDRAELLARNGIEPDFFYTTPNEEAVALGRADLVLAIQADERRFYEKLTRQCVIELGYPVGPLPAAPCTAPAGRALRVGYMGSNNSLNRKSLRLFLQALHARPDVAAATEVIVAGSICQAVEDPAVRKLGIVEREADLYAEIDVAVNPMVDGTGLKIKTLSALEHGVPLLSTEAGSAGIPAFAPQHRAADVEQLVDHLEALVGSPDGAALAELQHHTLQLHALYQAQHRAQTDVWLRALSTRSIAHARRKRVLLVTDIAFWEPGWGSHARILQLCRTLRERFDLTIFFFGSLWPERRAAIARVQLDGIVVSYKDYEAKANTTQLTVTCPSPKGLQMNRHDSFAKALRAYLVSVRPFDAVVFEYLWMAYTRDALPYKALTVIDTHDLMAPREYRFKSQGVAATVSIELREEIEILERFDVVLAIQHEEARLLARTLQGAFTFCCPHGVDAVATPPRRSTPSLKLGFVGTDSSANVEAVQWFMQQVWPMVRHAGPELHVYGKVCQRLPIDDPQVVLHGLVPILEQAYADCDVMINPVIHGGGLKIKSVEALAHGRPLVSSPEGAVGITGGLQSGVVVAGSRLEFADAILALQHRPEWRLAMAEAALKAAREQFSPAHCYADLVDMIDCA